VGLQVELDHEFRLLVLAHGAVLGYVSYRASAHAVQNTLQCEQLLWVLAQTKDDFVVVESPELLKLTCKVKKVSEALDLVPLYHRAFFK